MLVTNLVANEQKIKEYNERIVECKKEYEGFCLEEISSISDKILEYEIFKEELEKDEDVKQIKDTINDIKGVFVCGLNANYDIENLTDYKLKDNYDFQSYGVCDNASQVIKHYNKLPKKITKDKTHIILLIPMFKTAQESEWGWRWHKWGKYIGVQNPQHEYLYDEENIDMVYVFEIFEIIEI